MSRPHTPPSLHGLVLAGGRSRRMGRDKGTLRYAGEPLVLRAYELLSRFSPHVHVSVRADQAHLAPYAALPLVVDSGEPAGPAAGLLAAWAAHPEAALCVLAVDMPRMDEATLELLLAARDPATLATAFRHADGTPEPLCTIWEPAARGELIERRPGAGISLRRVLEGTRAHLIAAPEPARLVSVNTPEDLAGIAADA